MSPDIDKALDTRIRSWKFEPITVDGRPVIAKTRMTLILQAAAAEGGYAFRMDRVWFGSPKQRSTTKPPRYPEDALRAGVGAKVMLVLRLDAAGNVVDVHGEQVSLAGRAPNEKIAEGWRRKFLAPTVAAAKRWKYEVSETIGGEAVGSTVRVPITFTVGRTKPTDRWNAFIPGPHHPAPWVAADSLATEGMDRLRDGDLQALDSRFKLKSDVAGTLL